MGALKTPATSGWEKPKFLRKQTGVSFGLEFDRNFRFRLEKDSKLGNMGSSLQFMVCRYMIELFSNKSGSNKIRKRENRSKFSAHLQEFPEPPAIFALHNIRASGQWMRMRYGHRARGRSTASRQQRSLHKKCVRGLCVVHKFLQHLTGRGFLCVVYRV